jgi:hypothetical protein
MGAASVTSAKEYFIAERRRREKWGWGERSCDWAGVKAMFVAGNGLRLEMHPAQAQHRSAEEEFGWKSVAIIFHLPEIFVRFAGE